jgi:hypothetical protein
MIEHPRRISIEIDELVLDGVPGPDPHDPAAFRQAVTDAVLAELGPARPVTRTETEATG